MRKNIFKFAKRENGVTLVALITTLLVLAIVSTPLLFNTNNITEYRKFTKFKNDMLNLKEAVSNVYTTDKELSSDPNSDMYIGPEYKDWKTFYNNVNNKKQGGNKVINPNDKESTDSQITYFIIDLDNLSTKFEKKFGDSNELKELNYGEGNKKINTTTQDVYIINSQSRTIYYVKGFTMNNETYYRYQESYSKVDNILPGSTILRSKAPKISVNGLKYADLDNDGEADGIIVADLMADPTKDVGTGKTYAGGNPWGNSNGSFNGSFSYTKKSESELNTYKTENANYTYTGGGSNATGTLIKCTDKTKDSPRYYILSLANYDGNYHYWYYNAYGKMSDYSTFTLQDFGKGKDNTKNMIDRMKNHSDTSKYSVDYGAATTGTNADVWNIIEDKFNEGWFVPSRAEWAAFASYLNTSTTSTDSKYYVNYGLSILYWSSSQGDSSGAWNVFFGGGRMNGAKVNDTVYRMRLCETF